MTESRAVLVVSSSVPPAFLQGLRAHGWEPTIVRDLPAAAETLRTHGLRVALLMLEGDPRQVAQDFENCIEAAGHCEWVGLFPPGETTRMPWRGLVLAHFFDHHVHGVDVALIAHSLERGWARESLRRQHQADNAAMPEMGMVGRSPALQRLRREIRKGGPADAPVLVMGESGTGKELVARALHSCSPRSRGPFVAINCGALPPTLVHSELFGHERGSFSGALTTRRGVIESARGGTLFLDEIAELPLESQAMLLRFLQDGSIMRVGSGTETQVETRVIAATNQDLTEAVQGGSFRADLFFRLNVLTIDVPPLRERKPDIPLLAQYVYARTATGRADAPRGFHADAVDAMLAYSWPGNVRELINRVQRAVLMSEHALIRADDLRLGQEHPAAGDNLVSARQQAEKIAIRDSLQRTGQNVTQAARDLGVSRMTLYRLLAKHSITLVAK